MREPDTEDGEDTSLQRSISLQHDTESSHVPLHLPKNRSTGNLLANPSTQLGGTRIRFSVDEGSERGHDGGPGPPSPVIPGHEQSMGASGLRRIRQQPLARVTTQPPSPEASFSLPPRSSSMTLNSSNNRNFSPSTFTPAGPSSPTFNFAEDLSRFPSESLHSFSFAHQSEDALHSRQSLLKRSIDFMRDKLGWTTNHPGLVNAQAKVSGDAEVQDMIDLLAKANVLGKNIDNAQLAQFVHGPLTGPANVDGGNVFEKAFLPQSPEQLDGPSEPPGNSSIDQADQSKDVTQTLGPTAAENAEKSRPPSPGKDFTASQGSQTPDGRSGLKRTRTDLSLLNLQTKLAEAMARPYVAREEISEEALLSPTPMSAAAGSFNANVNAPSAVHGHSNRWLPPSQAIFTTETNAPWTILAANDLACLVFGVTKAEVKKLGILEVVREDERGWLEDKLRISGPDSSLTAQKVPSENKRVSPSTSSTLTLGGGVTAKLLSKPPSRHLASQKASKKGENDTKKKTNRTLTHATSNSRGVLLCGDVVPIQKRNGATGSASLWVKEKRGGLIWVLEEILEDTACITLDSQACVTSITGSTATIWGDLHLPTHLSIHQLLPQVPLCSSGTVDFGEIKKTRYYSARNTEGINIPTTITLGAEPQALRVSSFPHIAGIVVLSASTLEITSSNTVFSAALFGQTSPNGLSINELIPSFDKVLDVLTEDDKVTLQHGIVIPEHSFRRARAVLAFREGSADAAAIFLQPPGLIAKHRDGSVINVDVQMRVVRSERPGPIDSITEENSGYVSEAVSDTSQSEAVSEVVYALWITYSRQLHSAAGHGGSVTPVMSGRYTPRQISPGQNSDAISPQQMDIDDNKPSRTPSTIIKQQIEEAASQPISESPAKQSPSDVTPATVANPKERPKKKKITDFTILEDLGQGAYGSVKLARYVKAGGGKVVLKYVTKRRILVDTWTRDRRLGTVPLEIHVLDYLRRDGFKHPNIVEMTDFFEDDINYYIEMVPHGLPGMDLFDYIEMRSNMTEAECRNIFMQVVAALHHLHTKALVVHRDIKDENIILDGENKVKLIDFGSAAYIKNGPFDVFVGTIALDYAAPEVLQGRSYRGKEQDVWALGILLYTLVYKENPFYSIDEIMDHELRIPWIMSEASIDLIRAMLNREVDQRYTITQVMEHPWCSATEDET